MSQKRRLGAYHFYDQDWESFEALREAFAWDVPEPFNLATYVCDRWADDPNRIGLVTEGTEDDRSYVFAALRDTSNQFANYLADRGVERGDRVAVSGNQRVETLLTMLAAWKLGAIAVPVSDLFGPDGLGYRLADSGATVFVAAATSLNTYASIPDEDIDVKTVLAMADADGTDISSFWDAIEGRSSNRNVVSTDPDEPALIIYTSGTTGQAKGVVIPHQTVLGQLPGYVTRQNNMEIERGDIYYTIREWSWIGIINILATLFYGNGVLAHDRESFDPSLTLALVETHGVTVLDMPPTAIRMLQQLDDTDNYDLGSVRVIPIGGEAVGQSIIDWIDETFPNAVSHVGYGQTECALTVGECSALGMSQSGDRGNILGMPLPGHEVRIVHPDTCEPIEEPETVGEIAIRYDDDPLPFLKYWNKPVKTAQKVRDGWLLSEDLGYIDEDGFLWFKSRKDDVILSSGYRISPGEIEESLARHEAVVNAGVIGIPHDERGKIPKAFVVLADSFKPSPAMQKELQQYVKDHLAKFEYPRELAFIDELPTTSTGKVQRSELQARESVRDTD